MRRIALATVVAVLVGCTNDGKSDLQVDSGRVGDALSSALSQSDWTVETSQSGIDGTTHTASRVYEFPETKTQFQVAASCVANTGVSELTIDSFIGDPQSPTDGSAFLSEGLNKYLMGPVGRAKASDNVVTALNAYFRLGEDYNNRLKLDFNNPIAIKLIQAAPGYNAFASIIEEGDVNYARLLLATLPVTVQVKNGAGEFELEIDKSEEVIAAMQSCGAEAPLLSESYAAKAMAAEQSAGAEVLKNIRNICGYRGIVRQTSEAWIETAQTLAIPLDCAASAPQEFAQFNAKVDSYLAKAQEQGSACTREALLTQAEEQGIDNTFLMDRLLEINCSAEG